MTLASRPDRGRYEVGACAGRDEGLRPVYDVVVTVADRLGRHRRYVATSTRLGDAKS